MFKNFMSSVYALAGSMVIKDHNFAEVIENSIISSKIRLGLEMNPSHSKWKYYLNISGEYHPTDEVMKIISLDTLEEIDFTKANMVIHRSTKKGYATEGKYTKELLERYPNNHLLVKSILNPVDIDIAISAPNYTIMQWDANEVEIQEVSLIGEIQERIDILVDNWFNAEFKIFDAGYAQGFYKQLIAMLPLFIIQCREVNEFTYKVHSYYLWSYLETKAGLYKYKNYLNFQQANWLYRNINFILTNLGKQEVLDELIRILLTDKNIPIGKYLTDHLTEEMDAQLSLKPKAIVKKVPLNLLDFVGKEAKDNSISYLLKKEISLARSNGDDLDAVTSETEELLAGYIGAPLKMLETDVLSSNENAIYSLEETLIYHWAFYSDQNIYLSRFFIRNGKTGGMMTMDAKEAFVLYSYLIALKSGRKPTTFPHIELRDVVNPYFDKDLPTYLFGEEIDSKYIDLFNDTYPQVTDFISSESFREACVEYHQWLVLMNAAVEFPENHIVRNRYDEYMHRRLLNGILDMSIGSYTNIQNWIIGNNWDLEDLDFASIEATLLEIETKVLAIDSGIVDSATIQKKMTQLLDELTSYNIQIISSGNLEDARLNQTVVPEIGKYCVKQHHLMYSETSLNTFKLIKKSTIKRSVELDPGQSDVSTHSTFNAAVELDISPATVSLVSNLSSVDIF